MLGGSVEQNGEPVDKNRIASVAEQGEQASFREALVIIPDSAYAPGHKR